MRISEIHLKRYGHFQDVRLPLTTTDSHDFHLIFGPNEAGKSTLRNSIREALFGIHARTPYGYLHDYSDLRIGLTLQQDDEQLTFVRRKGNKGTLLDELESPIADSLLLPFIGRMSADEYERLFGLDQEFMRLGRDDLLNPDTDVGQLILGSTAGLRHLHELVKQLDEEASKLFTQRKSGAAGYLALGRHAEAKQELREALTTLDKYNDAVRSQDQAQARVEELIALERQHRAACSRIERRRLLGPLLARLDQAQQDLDEAGERLDLPADALSTFAEAKKQLGEVDVGLKEADRRIDAVTEDLAELKPDIEVIQLAAEIREMDNHDGRQASIESDIRDVSNELEQTWSVIRSDAEKLGIDSESPQEILSQLTSPATLEELNTAIEKAERATASLEVAEREAENAKLELKSAENDRTQGIVEWRPNQEAASKLIEDALSLTKTIEVADTEANAQLRRFQKATESLEPATFSEDAILSAAPPSPELARDFKHQLDRTHQQLGDLLKERRQRGEEMAELRAQINQDLEREDVVTAAQLKESRLERDTVWQSIKEHPETIPTSASTYEFAVAHADAQADHRIQSSDTAAALEVKQRRLDQLSVAQDASEPLLTHYSGRKKELEGQWAEKLAPFGLEGLSPDDFLDWHQRFIDARKEADSLLGARHAVDAARRQLVTKKARIAELLEENVEAIDLEHLRESLALIYRQHTESAAALKVHSQHLKKAKSDLQRREQDLRRATDQDEVAQRELSSALNAANFPKEEDLSALRTRLTRARALVAACEQYQRDKSNRLEPAVARWNGFKSAVKAATDKLGATRPNDPRAECRHLVARLEAAERTAEKIEKLQNQMKQEQREKADLLVKKQRAEQSLTALHAKAGTQNNDALEQAIESEKRRKELERIRNDARELLKQQAGEFDEEQVRALIAEIPTDEIDARLEEHGAEAEQTHEQLEQARSIRFAAEQTVKNVSLASQVPELNAERVAHASHAAQLAERYLELVAQRELLAYALRKFQEINQSPLLQFASEVMAQFTDGRYSQIFVDDSREHPALVTRDTQDKRIKNISDLSEGTRDQLLLSLRLGAVKMQISKSGSMPLICDDLLVNCDDQRAVEILRVLYDFSEQCQVIFLTHHAHLAALARETLPKAPIVKLSKSLETADAA